MRAIINVATGPRYVPMQRRLSKVLESIDHGADMIRLYRDEMPLGSPTHEENPYAFKVFAMAEAIAAGYTSLLWVDSSIVPIAPSLAPLWEKIERDGYWFSRNPPWNCGEWTCDAALPLLGITREEAFAIPQVIGTAWGVEVSRSYKGDGIFREWKMAMQAGAFCGPWSNRAGEASPDHRVKGHRHDQTALSVIAHHSRCRLTEPPEYIRDHDVSHAAATKETLLEIRR